MDKFIGKWRITEMEMWDQDFVDAEVPGYISFSEDNQGEFHFGYVHGYMHCRYIQKKEKVEFSWDGNDEMDPASGKGSAAIEGDRLVGELSFYEGDDSGFEAIKQ
ncbi:conserved hypothetical protein [Desulfamplus magnetovallimortis]|uniref:Lipocalin-like domain-containing protein n=1 Tax=Desulfamplus magnetovallimortis TaxID=1246637 RepID=A0A1W1HEQ5_9BACT|nr:hypothetical protein [Desulfamplus magnetovallimortis]SLM30950.1 conserved hypothetical protein [Desulfamplus magnetovallimortis]